VPAVPPREARRLARATALVFGALLAVRCAPSDIHARAARLDATCRTAAYTWIVEHEPSVLDVDGFSVDSVRPFDPGARIRAVGSEPRTACRQALRDRALLLIHAPEEQPVLRSAALDCGFALEHDATAIIVAPR
jgi:hypothetical protein